MKQEKQILLFMFLVSIAMLALNLMMPAEETAREQVVNFDGGEIAMVFIPPGELILKQTNNDPASRSKAQKQIRIKIVKGFWMAKYETTQELWQPVGSFKSERLGIA